jgi:hypothetical protein
MYSVKKLVALLVAFTLRAKDRHLVAILVERRRLLPNATIKWNRKILYDDEYLSLHA